MGEGKDRLEAEGASLAPSTVEAEAGSAHLDPENRASRLEEKGNAIRRDVDELLSELDRRRHRAMRTYLRPTLIGLIVAGVAAVTALAWRQARRRPSRTISEHSKQAARIALALRRAAAHPERIAADPARSVGKHAATTAISLGSLLAGQLIKRRLRS